MLFKYIIDRTIRKEFKKKGNSFITYKRGNELLQIVQSNITTEDEKDDIIMTNKFEFILGLIGGILGILFSSFAIFIGFISDLGPIMDSTTGEIPTNTTMILGSISLIASILGIIGSILIKQREH